MTGLRDALDAALGGWVLVVLVVLPLAAAAVLLAGGRRIGDRAAAETGTAVAAGTLVFGAAASIGAAPFNRSGSGLSFDVPWVPALGLRFHLGMDGVSAPLVLLTGLLTLLVCWHLVRVRPVAGRVRGLVACILTVEAGALATFTARDLFLFFVAFEVVLVPMWFVIALWGDDSQAVRFGEPSAPRPGGADARRDAAYRFVLYTALGSAVMLLGLVLVAFRAGTTDLDGLAYAAGGGMSRTTQTVAAVLLVLGLAVKAPMFPLHTWLPPAHTIAPTAGSVLLAGVLLKMGTYGLVRVVLPVVPDGLRAVAPFLGALGVAGILWGGLACLVERDLKRLVAFSSVAHMGFVLVGVASMTPQGVQGALFANVAHGLVTGLLFLVVGGLKDRHHSADVAALGSGLRDRMPRLGWLLAFGAVAGLGLPGLAGFWGELLAITGAWRGEGALGPLARPLAVLAAVGTVLAAAYLLRVLFLVWHGPNGRRPDGTSTTGKDAHASAGLFAPVTVGDATTHEVVVAAPLVLAVVALGLVPRVLLDVTGPAVRALLAPFGGGS